MTVYYKVIVLKVGLIETIIIDERHFSTRQEAIIFAEESRLSGTIPVIIEM